MIVLGRLPERISKQTIGTIDTQREAKYQLLALLFKELNNMTSTNFDWSYFADEDNRATNPTE